MRGSKSSGRRDGDLVLQGRDFLFGVSEKFGKKTEVMLAQHCECTKCLLKMSKMVNLTLDGHNTTFFKKRLSILLYTGKEAEGVQVVGKNKKLGNFSIKTMPQGFSVRFWCKRSSCLFMLSILSWSQMELSSWMQGLHRHGSIRLLMLDGEWNIFTHSWLVLGYLLSQLAPYAWELAQAPWWFYRTLNHQDYTTVQHGASIL